MRKIFKSHFSPRIKALGFILAVMTATSLLGAIGLAWTEPSCDPPGCNIPEPVNIGDETQTKTGNFGARDLLATNGYVRFSSFSGRGYFRYNPSADYAITWYSNNAASSNIVVRDSDSTLYGTLNGSGDGLYFGLTDGDGNWAFLMKKDDYSQFRINNEPMMIIRRNGANDPRVGIGTTSPQYRLHVAGGDAYADHYYCLASDIAEKTPAVETISPAEVVCLSVQHEGKLAYCEGPYDKKLAGVVSTEPGIVLGNNPQTAEIDNVELALAGRVPVKVTNENGNIEVGDWLTSSSLPGYAMKADPRLVAENPGIALGKAMESFSGEKGEILVLLSLK